jgi:copper chaperone CopZ
VTITRGLERVNGVRDVQVDVLKGEVRVSVASGGAPRAELAAAIERAGHPVVSEQGTVAPRAGADVGCGGLGVALALGRALG